MHLTLEPIGYLRSRRRARFLTPRQPEAEARARVELLPGRHLEVAVSDLAGFSRIWLLWWFHQNQHWRPKVLPPRGRSGRKGVLATRSPHRPNPLGLSAVPLLGVDGLTLWVGEHDLLDGTPILDIKPYIPEFDAFPHEAAGWLAELAAPPAYTLRWSPRAAAQLRWLQQNYHADFGQRVHNVLEYDPLPHRTRRILKLGEEYRLSCASWRIFFRLENQEVWIDRLQDAGGQPVPEEN